MHTIINIIIANCGNPELLPTVSTNESVPRVEDYDDLPIKGSTITFSCPPELKLTGPSSATCMDNGEWEPDLSMLMCNASKGYVVVLLTGSIILVNT